MDGGGMEIEQRCLGARRGGLSRTRPGKSSAPFLNRPSLAGRLWLAARFHRPMAARPDRADGAVSIGSVGQLTVGLVPRPGDICSDQGSTVLLSWAVAARARCADYWHLS